MTRDPKEITKEEYTELFTMAVACPWARGDLQRVLDGMTKMSKAKRRHGTVMHPMILHMFTEREWERMEQEEKIRVFKAKAQGSCIVCKREGALRCATCAEVYCSVECHDRDWDLYKGVCQPLLPIPEIVMEAVQKSWEPAKGAGEGEVQSRDNVPAF